MGEFPPNTKAILKLAKYFEVLPHNLLEDGEKMPEFPIGQSGSIDFASIKKEVLISINILSSQNVIHDIYRHTFVKYNDSMLEDLLIFIADYYFLFILKNCLIYHAIELIILASIMQCN